MTNLFKHVLEFLKQFDAVFGGFNRILLGFLLGVLGPGVVERIRRPYRRRDLTRPRSG